MRLCRLFTIIAKLKVSKYRIPGFSLQFAESLLFQLMDSPQHVVDDEMGNKVSGTGAVAASSSKEEEKTKEAVESPEADPDFAEELAELERAGSALLVLDDTELEAELPETPRSTSSMCIDGNPSQEAMTLRFDSDDTESRSVGSVRSRKSSVTSVKRAEEENMDQVSSEDENEFCSDNETKKKKKKEATSNRLSTESITSNDELRREEVVDGTPCQDEKEKVAEEEESLIDPEKVQRVTRNLSMGCEPISDTERDSDGGCETSRKVKLSTPLGMKIHIRSIEEELDDIESDEENYSEQEAVKKAQEEEDKEMEVVGDGEGGKGEEKEEQETREVEKLSEKEEEHEKEEEPGEYPWGFD